MRFRFSPVTLEHRISDVAIMPEIMLHRLIVSHLHEQSIFDGGCVGRRVLHLAFRKIQFAADEFHARHGR